FIEPEAGEAGGSEEHVPRDMCSLGKIEPAAERSEKPVPKDMFSLSKSLSKRPAVWLQVGSNRPLRTALEAARGDRRIEPLRPLVAHIRALQAPAPEAAEDLGALLPWTVLLVAPGRAQVDRLLGALRGHGLAPEALAPELAPLDLQAPTAGETRVYVA